MSISNLFTNPAEPGSFTGAATFRKNHKNFKLAEIKKELSQNEVYTLHKQVRRKFPERKVVVAGIDDQWQIDLLDIHRQKMQNSHMCFLLTVIDVFRRYAWVVAIKNKEAKTVCAAFERIFHKNKPPRYIYSDAGNEWKGECKKLFLKHNIIHIYTESRHKAMIVERFNQTLRQKIAEFVTWNKKTNGSTRFLDKLDELVASYNATIHGSLGVAPVSINSKNEDDIRRMQYGPPANDPLNNEFIKFKFREGDYVRLVVDKTLFEKGSTAKWSDEVYIVCQLNPTSPPTYKVMNLEGKEFNWKYYSQELQKISYKEFPFDTFKIIEQKGDKAVVVKLNSEKQKEVVVDRSLLE
jgi:hypothetical protein